MSLDMLERHIARGLEAEASGKIFAEPISDRCVRVLFLEVSHQRARVERVDEYLARTSETARPIEHPGSLAQDIERRDPLDLAIV